MNAHNRPEYWTQFLPEVGDWIIDKATRIAGHPTTSGVRLAFLDTVYRQWSDSEIFHAVADADEEIGQGTLRDLMPIERHVDGLHRFLRAA